MAVKLTRLLHNYVLGPRSVSLFGEHHPAMLLRYGIAALASACWALAEDGML